MKKKIGIYLAGSIKKEHEKVDESYWTESDIALLKKSLAQYEVSFLNPALRTDDLSDSFSVFGRDMLQVFSSNVVFVDARDRRGLGVGAEMMWAKVNQIPIVTWAPKNSHYHKERTTLLDIPVEEFIHPFVFALSDRIVENLEEGAHWIDEFISNPEIEIKTLSYIGEAMHYYKENQLQRDEPMQKLLTASEALKTRMHRSHPQ
jgi:hypothetical protein